MSQKAYLTHLDGVRGLAALWVLAAHCMIWGAWYWRPLPDAKLAVDVFMLVSGFLMVHQWSVKGEGICLASAGRFWGRRFFRIAPVYYLVLLLVVLLAPWFLGGFAVLQAHNPERWANAPVYNPANVHFDARNLLTHVTFVFGLLPKYSFSTYLPDWSIGLEMQFYLVFPLLLWFFRRLGPVATAGLGLLGSWAVVRLLVHLAWYHSRFALVYPEPSFLPLKLPLFLSGMLMAEAVRELPLAAARGALLAALGVAIAAVDSPVVGAAALVIFYPAATKARVLSTLLGNRVTRFMADTSYAVYLIHGIFISLAGAWLFQRAPFLRLPPPLRVCVLLLVTVAGSYGLGWLLHVCIERPGIRLGHWLMRSRRPAAAETSAYSAPAMA